MAGSTLGTVFSVSTWGESHGKGVGVVIDGCPAGLPLTEQDIQIYLNRRKPGQSRFTTPRKEDDTVEILSGVFEGRTTGTPISLMVRNTSQRSKDYSEIASYYRPGHADYTYDCKYGFRITPAADGLRAARPSDEWLQVPLLQKSCRKWASPLPLIPSPSVLWRLITIVSTSPRWNKMQSTCRTRWQPSLPWHISTSAVQKRIPAAA